MRARVGLLGLFLLSGVGCGGDDAGSPGNLVEVRPEPAGASCAAGGQAILVGADDDGDGLLDPAEVDATSYVCNGETLPATNGLLRLTSEPAGANCAAGGLRVDIGVDANGDGVLQDGEVTETGYACNGMGTVGGVLDGSFTIRNSVDAAILSLFTGMTGTLTIDAEGLESVSLPSLGFIDGDLLVINAGVGSARFGALTHAGYVGLESDALQSFEAPALTLAGDVWAGSGIVTLRLPALTEVTNDVLLWIAPGGALDVSALATVGGGLGIESVPNPEASTLFPALADVGGVLVVQLTNAIAIGFPVLGSVGADFVIRNDPLLATTAPAPALQTIGGDLVVTGNDSLLSLRLAALTSVAGDVTVSDNASFTSFGPFTALATIGGSFRIEDDPSLATVSGFGALVSIGGSLVVSRNDALVTFDAAAALGSLTGDLLVRDDPLLTSFSPGPASVGGDVVFAGDPLLAGLPGLPSVASIGGGLAVSGTHLSTLALDSLASIGGSFELRDNAFLTGVTGTGTLATIAGLLEVRGNAALTTLALPALTSVAQGISVSENDALTSFSGFASSGTTASLFFDTNANLQSISLPGLTAVNGQLRVADDPDLVTLSLPALTYVEDFSVENDDSLVNLSGLSALQRVGDGLGFDSFVIMGNTGLTSLGLGSLTTLSVFGIFIRDNPNLPTDCANDLMAQLTSPAPTPLIEGNGTGTCP